MSKTKRREGSEAEFLKGQIRKLESENRHLKKRIRALDKKSHLYDGIFDAVAEEIETDPKCQKCKNGKVKLVDLKYAQFLVCEECQDRRKV